MASLCLFQNIDGCTEAHWKEVHNIICEAIAKANFKPNLVSNSDDVGVIQKRIIQNLYENPIVVVDVSGKNPNVMFELGLRLAFDKPTIIIKDDKTKYGFDTSPIEHLDYPRDLRFTKIVDFKEKLTDKIIQTYEKSTIDANFSTFLKHFGSFKVPKIETEEITKEDYIIEEIKNLRELVLRSNSRNVDFGTIGKFYGGIETSSNDEISICFKDIELSEIESYLSKIKEIRGVSEAFIDNREEGHCHIEIKLNKIRPKELVIKSIERLTNNKANYIN